MKKKNICLLFAIFCCLPLLAQQMPVENRYDGQGREKIRAAHAAYITERLQLTSAEAEKFWPVYREYNEKRRALRQQLRHPGTPAEDGKDMLDRDLEIKQQELDLEKDYTKRMQEVIPPEKLVRLRPAEADFRRLVLRQLQQRRRRR